MQPTIRLVRGPGDEAGGAGSADSVIASPWAVGLLESAGIPK